MRKLVIIAFVTLAACANSAVPRSGPSESSPVDTTTLDAYEALIRSMTGSEPGPVSWETVYVLTPICNNAGQPEEAEGCDAAISADEQAQLFARLSDLGAPVEFIVEISGTLGNRVLTGKERSIIVHLGPISPQNDGSLQIPASYNCGGLCGSGTTHVLTLKDGRWEVTGSVGGGWIA